MGGGWVSGEVAGARIIVTSRVLTTWLYVQLVLRFRWVCANILTQPACKLEAKLNLLVPRVTDQTLQLEQLGSGSAGWPESEHVVYTLGVRTNGRVSETNCQV